jgi:hypothetical protein
MNLPVLVHMILVITFSVILVRILGLYIFHKMWKDVCESVRGFWSNHSSTRICLLKSSTRDNEYIVGLGIYYQTKHIDTI